MIRKLWINCSEASGDMCAGALAEELFRQNPTIEISGMGGPVLSSAGVKVLFSMNRICFNGFIDVLLGLPKIFRLQSEITQCWEQDLPDAIVMVDCPDFNLPLAKAAHALNIPVYYFVAPQFWAWKQQGMKNMQKYVRSIICALPFEPEYFHKRGCEASYAGHPLQDVIPLQSLDELAPDCHQVGIMPGSRKKEISFLLPDFAEAASRIHETMPLMKFSIARAPGINHEFLHKFWPSKLPMNIVEPENRFQMIRKSSLILAASGTATLETALIGTPAIVAYKIDRPAAFILRKLAISKFISLTNILSQAELFPEYLQEEANAENYFSQIMTWLNNPNLLFELRNKLKELRQITGPSGGTKAAVKIILA